MTFSRHGRNPILTRGDIPNLHPVFHDPTSVFNPGAVYCAGKIILILRVQTRGRETYLLTAESKDGVSFDVSSHPVRFRGMERVEETVYHIYDPRITRIDDDYYIMFAADVDAGCRLGVARTTDFVRYELVGIGADRDIRNGVLFPERIDGLYVRLDRPNCVRLPGGPSTGSEIALSTSEDLVEWEPVGPVLSGRLHFWDELVGSGPPPVRVERGWLHIYHGVARHIGSTNIYQAGVALLDYEDPTKVIARSRNNVLEPRELYELVGQVPNVVFPSGWVIDGVTGDEIADEDATVRLYYGAADTCVALATTTIRALLLACHD